MQRIAPWARRISIAAALAFILIPSLSISSVAQNATQQPATATKSANRSPDELWLQVEERLLSPDMGDRLIVPKKYRTIQLRQDALRRLIQTIPMEFTADSQNREALMTLPMPDGSYQRFIVVESPIMEPALAAQHPEIKTFSGQGLDDRTATLRFDQTPTGFHALIISAQGTVYVDPYRKGDTISYISYNKNDYKSGKGDFQCLVGGAHNPALWRQAAETEKANASVGNNLFTYRLAVAATAEYSAFFGGAVDKALAAITTTINRVNSIYERDSSIRFILVADEAKIIYTDPATQPYTNNNSDKLLDQNQANLDAVIGDANYDLGHVFATAGGGLGALGCLCTSGSKAAGMTGSNKPVGDAFDVDFVAHEIGHQLNANHTFNVISGGCKAGDRNGPTAFEPGSGSTIMGYASLCSPYDLQKASDDYFHAASFDEIYSKSRPQEGGNGCAKLVATGNQPPVVTAGNSYSIPKQTPFALTANAKDPDGDGMTYTWEEMDAGTASPPETDDGTRALFRSLKPTSNPTRTFPSLPYILNNANVPPANYTQGDDTYSTGEQLPSTTRTMKFRVTVRDNRAGGGGVATADAQVGVTAAAGPFVVTQPNTATTWAANATQTVKWDVADTDKAPVNAANVKILLSTDGGLSFPIVLAEKVPNNGSADITVPNTPTANGRIKVEAFGNIFFDISDVDIIINGVAFTQTSYLAQFANGDGWVSGFLIVNPSLTKAASGKISFFNDNGTPVAIAVNNDPAATTVFFSIKPMGSAVFNTNGEGSTVSGSVQIASDNPLASVIRFSYPSLGIAGVGESAAYQSLMTPVVQDASKKLNTGIAIANPQASNVDVSLSLRGLDGVEVAGGSTSLSLAANGHKSNYIPNLFPSANTANFQGTLVATATTAGGKIVATVIQLGSALGDFTTLPVVGISPATTTKDLYFAHYANGGTWASSIFITNPGDGAATGQITAYDNNGVALPLAFNGLAGASSVPYNIASRGGAVFATDGQGDLAQGSIQVAGANAIGGVLRFAAPGLGLAGVGASSPVAGFITPIKRSLSANLSTGVAVAALNTPVNLTLTLRDSSGAAVSGGIKTWSLKANGHQAGFIEQIFPEADVSNFEGTLTVTADAGTIVGTAIQLGAKAGELTTLPVTELR